MKTEYHYNAKGQLVDKFGNAKKGKVMQDGESIVVGLMFTDGQTIEDADPYGDAAWFGHDTADTGGDPYNDAAWFGSDYQPDRAPQRTADASAFDDHSAEAEAAYREHDAWLQGAAA